MASDREHQEKADHNRAFLNSIAADEYCDWIAVVAFYAAVHLVEKLRALRGQHSQDHQERNTAVRGDFRRIHRHYRELYNWSLVARYDMTKDFRLSAKDVRTILVDQHLVEIEKFVASQSAKKPTP